MSSAAPANGLDLLQTAEETTGTDVVAFVAATAVWANPRVHDELLAKNPLGLWFPDLRRYHRGAGEKRGQVIDGIRLDDNTYANNALKNALPLGSRRYVNYCVCHVWQNSCYNERCYTVMANLVLIPSPLMSLTDFHKATQDALQYRSWELYHWRPTDASDPSRPELYPSSWRPPEPFTADVEARLRKRLATPGGISR
jgi:hypothetical protein